MDAAATDQPEESWTAQAAKIDRSTPVTAWIALVGILAMLVLWVVGIAIFDSPDYPDSYPYFYLNIAVGVVVLVLSIIAIRARRGRGIAVTTLVLSILLNPGILFGVAVGVLKVFG